MWLLLVAVGTGYFARCWQKSCRFKTGRCLLKCNATVHSSQGSPSHTPRRGRSTTLAQRGLRKRSQPARGVGRKLLHGRKEGKLVRRTSDDNLGFSDKVFDDSLCSEDSRQYASDHATRGQEKTSSLIFCMHGKDHYESFTENCFCIKSIAANDDQTENASLVSAPVGQLMHAVPAYSDFLRDKIKGEEVRHSIQVKLKKTTEKAFHFLAKVARHFGHRACSKLWKGTTGSANLRPLNRPDVRVFNYLAYRQQYNKCLSEEKLKKQRFGRCFVHSQHLKALLDLEVMRHCPRCNYLPFSLSSYGLENGISCSADFTGLGLGPNGSHPLAAKFSGNWVPPFETTSVFAKPMDSFATSKLEPLCARENCLHSFDEVSYVALGVAMGVLLVTTSRSNELEDLQMLLRNNNTLIQELKKEINIRLEPAPLKLPEVENAPSGTTNTNLTCSQNVPEISSWPSRGEKDFANFLNANNNHDANEFWGFDDLEAELEAELQLIELNVCNTEQAQHESERIQLFQNEWQPKGDENGYVGKLEGEETSYLDIDIYDPVAMQDAGQVHESDFVVPPLELERRLWQVLEQRHEERISELENDLRVTQETVTAKEMEVQWWKDRVLQLLETSPERKAEVPQPACLNV